MKTAEQKLKEAGIQPTAQRMSVLYYLLNKANHPTAEDVKVWMDDNFPKVSRATVYNTLHTLVKVGLAREVRLPHSDKVFYDKNVTPHYHFWDESTGELYDIDTADVNIEPKLGDSFTITEVDVVIKGRRNQ